ncbi:hypothetical protein [Pediococcus claussenii]|uniref:Uncharacterized protein n=1 Tax=Pediococcus claussenii (strain ATCC BAA-344 / DSM 14800 / JCM 18046 / KCTC 3811 / LMG 21948 / P06) TaxID=701521 RepID=G8PC78_PEDCP|nr:hypothetical protein [Pediococcus claussenii]AEV96056.1 hypothetical protein PECL_2029 [Pediococcus claussenii ATCC BAA-344]KRN19420.1 hypothetical protein IV79_GL001472 [Pediococcus claussenii]
MDQFYTVTLFITRWIFILFTISAICGGLFVAVKILTDHPQTKNDSKPTSNK